MDIYERLTEDHHRHRCLSGGLANTSGASEQRGLLFDALKAEIESHAAIEEQTFYAELIGLAGGQGKARHSISEHEETADLLEELTELDMSSGAWLIKFKNLQEDLEHHMKEEEKEVFKLARSLISDERARELGHEFDRLKHQALAE